MATSTTPQPYTAPPPNSTTSMDANWIVALIIFITLGSGAALAFECTGVRLPSRIVICGDPELMRLADARQEALYEARARIGEDRFSDLWADQKVRVRS